MDPSDRTGPHDADRTPTAMSSAGPRAARADGPDIPPAISLQVAIPDEEHARLVMAWRNDPVTLAASFHVEPKRWPEFFGEYRGYFDPRLPPPLFGVVEGEPVAFLRFRACADPEGLGRAACDISINVAAAARGRGWGRELIALATDRALDSFAVVLAEIKPGNGASVRAFLGAGYRPIAAGTHEVDGVAVPVERLVATR